MHVPAVKMLSARICCGLARGRIKSCHPDKTQSIDKNIPQLRRRGSGRFHSITNAWAPIRGALARASNAFGPNSAARWHKGGSNQLSSLGDKRACDSARVPRRCRAWRRPRRAA
jgi:hypothetical protein